MVESYRIASQLPRIEQWGMASQLRRAAVSVPANIAEGNGRASDGEFLQALSVARGELREVETYLVAIEMVGYLKPPALERATNLASQVSRMLFALRESIEARRRRKGK